MKKTMNTRRMLLGLLAAGCAAGMTQPPRATAEVTEAAFNALQEAVRNLTQQVQNLQLTNNILQQKVAETQKTADDAEQKSVAASQTQPLPRVPIDKASVNHNFQILGDAGMRYVRLPASTGRFYNPILRPFSCIAGGTRFCSRPVSISASRTAAARGTVTDSAGDTTAVNNSGGYYHHA